MLALLSWEVSRMTLYEKLSIALSILAVIVAILTYLK